MAPVSDGDPGVLLLAAGPSEEQIPVMLVGIAVVLMCAVVLGRIAVRLGQPAVVGEITAGILLGPTLLGSLPGDPSSALFPDEVRPLLFAVAQIGLVLFMFVVGWEFERRLVRPNAGLAAGVSLFSIVLPFTLGFGIALLVHPHHSTVAGQHVPFLSFALFLGAAMSVTAFPVLARIISDRGLQGSRVGTLALASAAIDDVIAWMLLALVSALIVADGDLTRLVWIAGFSVLFVVAMLLIVRPLVARLVRWGVAGERWSTLIMLLCAGAFVSAWLTSLIGIHAIFGAFLFGFAMPREPARVIVGRLRTPVESTGLLFLPVFFIITGLNVDLSALTRGDYLTLVLVLVVACTGKMIGAYVPARISGLGRREAKDLGVLMNTRGLTELVILNVGVSMGVLDERMFTMLVIMALVTTMMAGPLLSRHRPSDARPHRAQGSDLTRTPS